MCSFLAKFEILLSMRTQKSNSKIAKILQRYFLMHVLFVVISNLKFEKSKQRSTLMNNHTTTGF